MSAVKKVKLPNNTTLDIQDARVVSDGITYIGDTISSATYESEGIIVDLSDYQPLLVSGTNIKTINNTSLLGSGNISISGGGGGGGDVNVIEVVKVNGTALTPDANKAVDVTVPTESTVSGWGFTKNTGTYSKPSDGIPSTDLASSVQTSLGRADTALQSYTETDPTVPSWAKASSKPSYTATEVGALSGVTFNNVSATVTSGVAAITATIPTVPTISTSITSDATSDTKTASPKAVKTYVDGIVGDIETLLAAI